MTRARRSPHARRDRPIMIAGVAAALVLLAVMLAPTIAGRVATWDDLGSFHLPLRAFYARQLAAGESFDWMPELFAGFCLTGEGQVGTYHPLHWLLYRTLPLGYAFGLELWLSYPFLLVGSFLLLRRRLPGGAALFGAVAFAFSSFNLLHYVHPNAIAVVAHLPWLLWCIDLLHGSQNRTAQAAAFAGIGLATGSQLLLGYPQYVWFSLLAEGTWVGWLLWGESVPGRGHCDPSDARGEVFVFLLRLGVALALGILVGAVQLLPSMEALRLAARRTADSGYFAAGTLHPLNLLQWIAPYWSAERAFGGNTHECGIYLGAVPLVLVLWLRCRWAYLGRLRGVVAALAAAAVVAFLMALGRAGVLFELQRRLPLVGSFRCPCRAVVLMELALAGLAAIGFWDLFRVYARRISIEPQTLHALLILAVASSLVAALGLLGQGHSAIGPWWGVLAGPLLVSTAVALVVCATRGIGWALPALVAFTVADLGIYGLTYAILPETLPLSRCWELARVDLPPAGVRAAYDLVPGDRLGPRTGNHPAMAGVLRLDGYAGLEPARQLNRRELATLRVSATGAVHASAGSTIRGLVPDQAEWLRVPDPLPMVRLVSAAQRSRDPSVDLPNVDLEKVALVPEPIDGLQGPPGCCVVLARGAGRWSIRVACSGRQLLTVAESYHPGWRATIDGRRQNVVRVNGDFMGCVVPRGEHEVFLQFAPESVRCGKWLSLVGLLSLGLAVCVFFFPSSPARARR